MDSTKEDLEKLYRSLSDEKLQELAYYEADGLTPEALEVLKSELKRRSVSDDFEAAIDVQTKGLSPEEKSTLVKTFSELPCPSCGERHNFLNASKIMIVKSVIIGTVTEKPLIIGCPSCITQKAKDALIKSAIYGWWGIPWGPFKTIKSIFVNFRAKNPTRYYEPTREFIEFIEDNAGLIKAKMEKREQLYELM